MAADASKLWILGSTILVGLLAFIFYPLVGQSELDTWLNKEYTFSKSKLLANIGPKGSRAQGAHAGVVIASPSDGSNDEPDYVYTWTRDAALVMQKIVDLYVVCRLDCSLRMESSHMQVLAILSMCRYTSGSDISLRGYIDDFVKSQTHLQTVSNPSGGPTSGGLTEPKFHINLTAFTDPWG
jgi:glucoamylase